MELKKPLNFNSQVDKLIEHGIIINNVDEAIEILKQINYYRLTGYALQFRKNTHDSDYIDNIHFDTIYNLYLFDESFRNLLHIYLEKIEIYYRTQIAHYFSIIKCNTPPYNQHYDPQNFYNKEGYNDVMHNFKREKQYYKDSLIVKHHDEKYNNIMPLWVMVDLMSFSNLSKLYSSMYNSEQDLIATNVGISPKTLKNHLHCLVILRNKCAHAARLYNTTFALPARFTSSFLRKYSEIRNNTLFAYLIILIKRLPSNKDKNELKDSICILIDKYNHDIDISLIGFPDNYKEILSNIIL